MQERAERAGEPLEVAIRNATSADLNAICRIEQVSFRTPWSRTLLANELAQGDSVYLVAGIAGDVVGFVGMWYMLGEAHICTLAVTPERRGLGLGELLVLAALEEAAELGADAVHLEYRVSNACAASLYEKLGFRRVGRRRRYYSDTGEDAVLARIDGLTDPEGRRLLREAWERWRRERGLRLVRE